MTDWMNDDLHLQGKRLREAVVLMTVINWLSRDFFFVNHLSASRVSMVSPLISGLVKIAKIQLLHLHKA